MSSQGEESSPLFDRSRTLAQFRQNEKLVGRLIQTFLLTTPSVLESLRARVIAADWSAVADLAHNYKGAVANFGAAPLVALAQALETPDPSQAADQLEQLEALHAQIAREMQA